MSAGNDENETRWDTVLRFLVQFQQILAEVRKSPRKAACRSCGMELVGFKAAETTAWIEAHVQSCPVIARVRSEMRTPSEEEDAMARAMAEKDAEESLLQCSVEACALAEGHRGPHRIGPAWGGP